MLFYLNSLNSAFPNVVSHIIIIITLQHYLQFVVHVQTTNILPHLSSTLTPLEHDDFFYSSLQASKPERLTVNKKRPCM